MRLGLAAAAAFSIVACGTLPPASNTVGSNSTGASSPTAGSKVMSVSGAVATNATWSDTVNITADTTINAGVNVTVKPGTTVNVATKPTLTIYVKGTLDIQGTSAAKVIVQPTVAGGHWNRFVLPVGGQLRAHYLVETGGGFKLIGGMVTLIDSEMSSAIGDLLEGNGSVDVEYSSIGLEPGHASSTHCDMHFDRGANRLKVTHTNISAAVYGMMFYGGTGADFTYDNWFSNTIDVHTLASYPVRGDFSFGWFARSAPGGPGITAHNLAKARLPVGRAGPRP